MIPRTAFGTFIANALLLSLAILGAPTIAFAGVSFSRDIQPILAEHCLKCHGGVKEAGKLNLQFREQALKGGASDLPGIVPGKPEQSELIKRLLTEDEDERMPKKAPPLKSAQIQLLKQWIAEGAHWEKHWAYETPRNSGRSIDAIVSERLKREQLALAPEVDRWILARRTSLDLTGVPAPLAEVEAFVRDTSPQAYERWVDRLLASSAYGERWAAVWLDLARYADSRGYEKDGFRDMWRYRDWLIDSFNHDKPYDQFVTEQLAGDLLPKPTDDQIIATAFHRNTQANDEGGTDDEEFRIYAVIDRLNTTFEVLQGTTIGCVQCHGHPYDPFVHREYYQLMAFFNNTADSDRGDEAPTQKFYSPTDTEKAAELKKTIAEKKKELDAELARDENRQAFDTWTEKMRQANNVAPLKNLKVTSTHGSYQLTTDGRVLLKGDAPEQATITVELELPPGAYNALGLETGLDKSLPQRGPGAAENGNFVLTHLDAVVISPNGQSEQSLVLNDADASIEQGGFPIGNALKKSKDGGQDGIRGWAIAGGTGKAQSATFYFTNTLQVATASTLRVTLACEDTIAPRHVLGAFQITAGRIDPSISVAGVPSNLRRLLAKNPSKRKSDELAQLQRHFFIGQSNQIAGVYQTLDDSRKNLAALPQCDLLIMRELTGKNARTTKIFNRGNWLEKGDVVTATTPNILNSWPTDYPSNRLGFAKWLTSGENPLTARVHVNRVWEQLFGIGLVETLEDFGTQGDRPIHPELLDTLAARFQTDLKWSQKSLLREIVLSRTYRQSANVSKSLLERDPANRLLARGPRFRLSSEQLRDQALTVGGLLSRKMFGPPVMPYQPPGSWQVVFDGRDWATSPGEDAHRRALYTFVRRSSAYPSFLTFDAPSREFCLARRLRTNTPLQALDLLDSPVFFEAAEGLSKRMVAEGGKDLEGQLARGLWLATQRPPRPEAVAALKKLHARVGDLKQVANVILNLDEVLNKN